MPGTREFDDGFELFCEKCSYPLARYYERGPKAGTETAHVCRCEVKQHTDLMMPKEVRVQDIRAEHKASPLHAYFGKSVVVRSSRMDVLSVVKCWWYHHNLSGGKRVMLVPDNYIRDLGFGDYSKKNRSDDYVGPTYNTIDDFVVPPDLLIIQLGVIQTGTKGGYFQAKLYEAIYTRYTSTKPFWLLIKPDTAFTKAYYPHVWSEEAAEVVRDFPVVDSLPRPRGASPGDLAPEPAHREEAPERPRRRVRSAPDDGAAEAAGEDAPGFLSTVGSGVKKSRGLRGRD